MTILLTGGAGFIGSHTYVALTAAGFSPVILDNFSNSQRGVLDRLHKITGQAVILEEGDVGSPAFLRGVFQRHHISAVVHFAALKSVGESCAAPLLYYRQNVEGLINLLDCMTEAGCNSLIYSSSATVYGAPEILPVTESAPLHHLNPYGHTKIIGEEIIGYARAANSKLTAGVLRYFNPVGAHESGLIGEEPQGTPNNLMPYISQVAAGKRPHLNVYGNDYPTPDGTGVRDYIHVMDLAEGHVIALRHLMEKQDSFTVNLGTGGGHSVLEMVQAFERASGKAIPTRMQPRRAGDSASSYADASLAEKLLGWKATRDINAMCADTWRWQSKNPNGYSN